MSWFSNLFGGRSKAVQTNQVTIPSVGGFEQYNPLSKFGLDRMAGIGAGFGEDFISLANPAIKQREASFQNKTVPFISNQASSRGLGRSSLATSQLGEAELAKQRDIDSMLAQFDYLNRVQQKSDITEGVGVNERLLDRQSNRATQQAQLDQSRNTTNAGLQQGADQFAGQALTGLVGNTLTAGGGFVGGGGVGQLLGKFGFGGGQQSPALQSFGLSGLTGSMGPQANILGSINPQQLQGFDVEKLLALLQ